MRASDSSHRSGDANGFAPAGGSGFLAAHASGLFFVVVGQLLSVLALVSLGPIFLKLGLAAIFYLGLITFAIAAFAYLPVHWGLRHRRFHRIAVNAPTHGWRPGRGREVIRSGGSAPAP